MRQRRRRRVFGAALLLGSAGVLMGAGPAQADGSGGTAPPVPVPSGAPSAPGLPEASGLPSVPGVPAPSGSDSGGDTAGSAASGGETGGGSDSGGSDSGGGGGGGSFPGKEVQVPYKCKTPIGDKEATSPVRIDATKSGETFELTVKFGKSVMDSPAQIPADSVKPSMDVKVGGDDKGTVKVEGPTNKDPIKQGDPIEIPDLKGPYKPGASGKATLTPGVLTVEALGTTTTCTPAKDPGVSLELDTTDQGGVASGGDSAGGAASAGGGSAAGGTDSAGGTAAGTQTTGGGLAETGASDGGAVRALGLVAGTVILLGGAVFTFTPWRRLRGVR